MHEEAALGMSLLKILIDRDGVEESDGLSVRYSYLATVHPVFHRKTLMLRSRTGRAARFFVNKCR